MKEKKKIVFYMPRAVLTLLAVLLLAPCGVRAQSFGGGSGTANDPYLITCGNDLKALVNASHNNSFNGVYFRQTADIDAKSALAELVFKSIGNVSHPFGGHYDGDHHEIRSFTVNTVFSMDTLRALFGCVRGEETSAGSGVYRSATLKNIVLVDCSVKQPDTRAYVAGICAYAGDSVTIENCRVTGTLYGHAHVAGITFVRGNNVTVKGCFADVKLTGQATDKAQVVSNIVPNGATIDNCYYHAQDTTLPAMTGTNSSAQLTQLYTVRGTGLRDAGSNATLTVGDTRYFATGSNPRLGLTNSKKVTKAHFVVGTSAGATMGEIDFNRGQNEINLTMGTGDIVVALTGGWLTDTIKWSLDRIDNNDGEFPQHGYRLTLNTENGIIIDNREDYLDLPLFNTTDNIAPWKGDTIPLYWCFNNYIKTIPK